MVRMSEYDFFLNPEAGSQKPTRARGPSSMGSRLLVVGGALVAIIILLWIVFGVVLKPDSGPTDRLAAVSVTQGSLIQVAQNSNIKLKTNDGRQLATGARLLLTSEQIKTNQLLDQLGREVTKEELASAVDTELNQTLLAAESANRYDAVFIDAYSAKLLEYRSQLAQAYQQTNSEEQKEHYNSLYANVSILLNLDIVDQN